jgi:hypothetical protein
LQRILSDQLQLHELLSADPADGVLAQFGKSVFQQQLSYILLAFIYKVALQSFPKTGDIHTDVPMQKLRL